jgi:hypothetical protein
VDTTSKFDIPFGWAVINNVQFRPAEFIWRRNLGPHLDFPRIMEAAITNVYFFSSSP